MEMTWAIYNQSVEKHFLKPRQRMTPNTIYSIDQKAFYYFCKFAQAAPAGGKPGIFLVFVYFLSLSAPYTTWLLHPTAFYYLTL